MSMRQMLKVADLILGDPDFSGFSGLGGPSSRCNFWFGAQVCRTPMFVGISGFAFLFVPGLRHFLKILSFVFLFFCFFLWF